MAIEILVLGDTHLLNFEDLPKSLMEWLHKADGVIHVGDYASLDVLNGFMTNKGINFNGVYGNADPKSIREKVPFKDIIEINGRRIGIIHPATGGLIKNPINRVLTEFKDQKLDIIIYGHTHESSTEIFNGILFINPGKGYLEENSFGPPPTFVVLTIDEEINVEIKKIK
jgi:putative phosphoesterase